MRRALIVLLALVMVTSLAAIASAAPGGVPGKPPGDTTTTTLPVLEDCTFTNGVLEGWDGTTDDLFICAWTVTDRPQTFSFHMQGSFRNPYLGIKDAFLPEGDFCAVEQTRGYFTDFLFTDVVLPESGVCGDRWDDGNEDLFAVMVMVGKARGNEQSHARLCLGPCP
jgi:hypothetical protein